MRLITRKLYRAFPELDAYDDDRCERFVRAARGTQTRRGLVFLACLTTWAAVLYLPLKLFISVLIYAGYSANPLLLNESPLIATAYALTILVLIVIAPLAAYMARDALMRLRLRHLLRNRGSCISCGYGLIGLPVGSGNRVTCPECHSETEVDPSLGELVISRDGGSYFKPRTERGTSPRLSAKAKRRIRLLLVRGLPALTLILFGTAGYHEWFLRSQAAAAHAARPGAAGMIAYIESLQPADVRSAGTDAWELLEFAEQKAKLVDSRVDVKGAPLVNGKAVFSDPSALLDAANPDSKSKMTSERLVAAEEARKQIGLYRKEGVFAAYDAIADARRVVGRQSPDSVGPEINLQLPGLGRSRALTRLMASRMLIAAENADMRDYAAAFRTGLGLARITAYMPTSYGYVLGLAIENFMHHQVRRDLLTNTSMDDTTIGTLMDIINEQRWFLPGSHPWKADYLANVNIIAWVFERPSRVRFGRLSGAASEELLGGPQGPPGRLGTFEENRSILEMQAISAEKLASQLPFERPESPPQSHSGLMLIELLSIPTEKAIFAIDQQRVDRIGTIAMLEIERYSRRAGHRPDTLGEVFADRPGELPIDPFSGKPLCYKRIDPDSDPKHREYLLYSVGGDGRDDGGNSAKSYADPQDALRAVRLDAESAARTPQGTTLDYIINSGAP